MSNEATPEVKLLNVMAFVQKAYPGVSGEVHYHLQYRVELDLETTEQVKFKKLVIGETEIPIQSVSVGMKLLNTHLDEHPEEDTGGIRIKANYPVYHNRTEPTLSSLLESPGQIILEYEVGKETRHYEITEIKQEPDEYRPSAPPGGME